MAEAHGAIARENVAESQSLLVVKLLEVLLNGSPDDCCCCVGGLIPPTAVAQIRQPLDVLGVYTCELVGK